MCFARYFTVFILIILFIISFSCTKSDPHASSLITPTYNKDLSPDEVIMAKKAFGIFCQTCKPLMNEYASDIEKIEISESPCITTKREYGWTKQFDIMIKIKDRPEIIPFKTYAWGHTECYTVGGAANPGFTMGKHPILCGVENGDPHSLFRVPSMSFLKNKQ